MSTAGAPTIAIELETLDELFTPPLADPLAGRFETSSGVHRIEQLTRMLPPQDRAQARITITVPPQPEHAELSQRIGDALAGYTQARITEVTRSLGRTLHAGRDALWLGLGFLACCMALSSMFSATAWLPAFVQRLFSEGLIIAGWVALWRPIELLLYDSRPFRQYLRVLKAISGMPVTIVERTLPAATTTTATAAAR
ncbi:hypothetical protein NIM87_15960 [Devosia sp. XJ19-1]|uniref:Uncharacterized protein n=1 Tax=Devosia ureilytica TaxID=2952754 RepID=A0A9Q4ARR7_9HYPH|nr:hypothetical protein [Devosia ureilytica]MCP8885006.1 hypothetical protein [Devosia ureilytica]MCP8888483.1 hypothetical protein [Devosia ureilytica]